jgi:hypothetical protein
MHLPCGITKIHDRYYLTRRHGDNIAWMDRRYQRAVMRDSEACWLDMPPSPAKAMAYVGRFADRPAVLLGKGPSLSSWLADPPAPEPGELLVAINEAFTVAPRPPDVACCLDVATLRNMLERGDTARHPSTLWLLPHATPRVALPEPQEIRFAFGEFGTQVGMATAAAALRWLWVAGVRRVQMVGFDGFDEDEGDQDDDCPAEGYAPEVVAAGARAPTHPSWEKVNRDIQRALDATGLAVTWWHRQIQALEPAASPVAASELAGEPEAPGWR